MENEKIKNVLGKIAEDNLKENSFSAYNPNVFKDDEDLSTNNYIAERIQSFNKFFLAINIITIIILFILFFVYDFEYMSFLIIAISELLVSLFIYYLISGLAEIINLLHSINKTLKK